MEDQTLVINGANTAPALYTVLISGDDDPLLAPYYPQLAREVCEFVEAQAEKKRYLFVGEPLARFMIDPSLKAGKFSVFAENVDAPTLGRLYEEERAYQNGLSGNLSRGNSVKLGGSPAPAAAPAPAPAASRAPMPAAAPAPAQPQAQSVNGIPNIPGFGGEADPFAPAAPAAAGLGAGMGPGSGSRCGRGRGRRTCGRAADRLARPACRHGRCGRNRRRPGHRQRGRACRTAPGPAAGSAR